MTALSPDVRMDTGAQAFLPAGELYRRARRIASLAAIAMDCTRGGRMSRDVARATSILLEISSIAGGDSAE